MGPGAEPAYVAVDVPGFGHSDCVGGDDRGVRAGHHRRSRCSAHTAFTLVGRSLGGATAADFAELLPAHLDALIPLSPA